MANKLIATTTAEYKSGFLYFCRKINGKVAVYEAPMARGGSKKKSKPAKKKAKK